MKSKTNIFLLTSALLAAIITIWIYYQISHQVGEIYSNSKIDGDFKVCDENKIPNYYALNTDYEGGKRAIKKELLINLQDLKFNDSGLITFRFVVNCEGNIGRFRVKSTNLNLKEILIDSEKFQIIKSALLKLKNWKPGTRKDTYYDSYYVLNFRIRQNQIIDIF